MGRINLNEQGKWKLGREKILAVKEVCMAYIHFDLLQALKKIFNGCELWNPVFKEKL